MLYLINYINKTGFFAIQNRSGMRLYIFFTAFALLICLREIQSDLCGLTGESCGRGSKRVDCCSRYFCDIAPSIHMPDVLLNLVEFYYE